MRQRDELSVIGAAGYRLNRRRLLRAAAASGMAALGLIPSTIRPGRFVRADTTINVLAPQWPQGPKEQALAEEWSKQSGIAVTFDAVNYANLEQRVKLLVDGESTDYDIYDYDSQWIGGFVQAGALERLDTPDYLGASGVAIRMGDFFPEITSRLCQYPAAEPNAQSSAPSPVYGLPWSLNCEVLWYRTDLMDAPPASWDDLRIQAKALTTSDVFGYATEGGRDADWIISEFAPIAWSNGGQLWDPATYTADGNLNSGQNAASLKFLADMVNGDKSIDPASANWTITERLGALLTGKAAMCLNWSPLFGGVADDDDRVAGRGQGRICPLAERQRRTGRPLRLPGNRHQRLLAAQGRGMAVPPVSAEQGDASRADGGRAVWLRLGPERPARDGDAAVAEGLPRLDSAPQGYLEHPRVRAAAADPADGAEPGLCRPKGPAEGARRCRAGPATGPR